MSRQSNRTARRHASTLRIIGGEWRGRRLPVADAPGLRPTPDRIRETLFNWLAPRIHGAYCIDMFAGTGALGLEALSRGAAHVYFVDADRAATAALRAALGWLDATESATVRQGDARLAPAADRAFDIVFIDPPFDAQLHVGALAALHGRLAPNARVYLEYPAGQSDAVEAMLGADYVVLRARRAGGVGYCLAQPALDKEDQRFLS